MPDLSIFGWFKSFTDFRPPSYNDSLHASESPRRADCFRIGSDTFQAQLMIDLRDLNLGV